MNDRCEYGAGARPLMPSGPARARGDPTMASQIQLGLDTFGDVTYDANLLVL